MNGLVTAGAFIILCLFIPGLFPVVLVVAICLLVSAGFSLLVGPKTPPLRCNRRSVDFYMKKDIAAIQKRQLVIQQARNHAQR